MVEWVIARMGVVHGGYSRAQAALGGTEHGASWQPVEHVLSTQGGVSVQAACQQRQKAQQAHLYRQKKLKCHGRK